ncbi:MAG: Hsp20/alpha crystallin family protein [Gammaproteobacteria bacterium]|nr:Hsp20/alpha crystallin family protein [Gammaproteobacteria bacterium]
MKKLSLTDQMNDLEDVVRGFMRRPFIVDSQIPEIRMDVREDDIQAEIPGAKKEDMKIDVDENYVSIAAQIGSQSERKNGGRWLCSERYAGSVSRGMSLAHEVDASKASASYENGILALTLPKKSRSAAHSISIR